MASTRTFCPEENDREGGKKRVTVRLSSMNTKRAEGASKFRHGFHPCKIMPRVRKGLRRVAMPDMSTSPPPPSRKGCVVNSQMTMASNKWVPPRRRLNVFVAHPTPCNSTLSLNPEMMASPQYCPDAPLSTSIHGVVAAASPRSRGGTGRDGRPVLRTGYAPKCFGLSIGVSAHCGI